MSRRANEMTSMHGCAVIVGCCGPRCILSCVGAVAVKSECKKPILLCLPKIFDEIYVSFSLSEWVHGGCLAKFVARANAAAASSLDSNKCR